MAYKIYGEGVDAMLSITVDGYEVFGMTLDPVNEKSWQWLAEHLDTKFQRASAKAFNAGRNDAQVQMRRALGME